MRAHTWLLTTIGLFVLGTAAVLAIVVSVDIYGLYHDDRGRSLPAYGDERLAKYLLCERYVPANFDGLLLGPSISGNWKPGLLQGFRIYNASVNGANITELKAIADQALASDKIRSVFLLVHPSLTRSHDFQTLTLTPRENIAALGSMSLLSAYRDAVLQHWHQESDGSGTEYFDDPKELNPINVKLLQPGEGFEIDPVALDVYRDLLRDLQARHVRTILIVPPLAEHLLARKPEAFARYTELIRAETTERLPVLDFLTERYKSFRCNRENFADGIHLTRSGADRLTREISTRMRELTAE